MCAQDTTVMSQQAPPAVKPPVSFTRDMEQTLGTIAKSGHSVADSPGQPWYLPTGAGDSTCRHMVERHWQTSCFYY